MGLRENENERELQKPDDDNAAFCSAFIQLQTTGHSLKMGAPLPSAGYLDPEGYIG